LCPPKMRPLTSLGRTGLRICQAPAHRGSALPTPFRTPYVGSTWRATVSTSPSSICLRHGQRDCGPRSSTATTGSRCSAHSTESRRRS
jgi:hypothetical protein